jgi:hypothetical protein
VQADTDLFKCWTGCSGAILWGRAYTLLGTLNRCSGACAHTLGILVTVIPAQAGRWIHI